MPGRGWLSGHYKPPEETVAAPSHFARPPPQLPPSANISPHMAGIRTEEELTAFIASSKRGTAVVEYGTSWCHKCHEIFPTFYALSKHYNQHKYAVAQVENMKNVVRELRYSPTFAIYKDGKKVDEVVGSEPQRLADHLWLHSA